MQCINLAHSGMQDGRFSAHSALCPVCHFPPPSQRRFVTSPVTKKRPLQRNTSQSAVIYLSVNADIPHPRTILANMCHTPAKMQCCQPVCSPSPSPSLSSCSCPNKMSPQPQFPCALISSQRLCFSNSPCGSIRMCGNVNAQPTHTCGTVPVELSEECEPLTLQISVCYLCPCYAYSVCQLQATAAAAAAAAVALCAVLPVGVHQSHSECAVKCSTVVGEGSDKVGEKAEAVARARDEWVCEFCGTECFCWRYEN